MKEIKINSLSSSLFIKELMKSHYDNEIAKCIGETPEYIHFILKGEIEMPAAQIRAIEKEFDVNFTKIIRSTMAKLETAKEVKKILDLLGKALDERVSKIKFTCFNCNSKLKMPAKYAGRKGRCPKCKAKNTIPSMDDTLEDTIIVMFNDMDDYEDEHEDIEEEIDPMKE